MQNYFWKDIWNFITNRLFIMTAMICIAFYMLAARLFDLQIVNGQSYANEMQTNILRELPISAPRGVIVDKYGRPLAVNQSAYNVKLDPSVTVENWNLVLYDLIQLFERNGDEFLDELPLSTDEPYTFTLTDKDGILRWKKNIGINKKDDELTAMNGEDTFYHLLKSFKIDENFPDLPNSELRKILALRSSLHMKRYSQYDTITVAFGVSDSTVTSLEEDNISYPGVFIETESLRFYPEGEYFSHILGYIGNINVEEYENMKDKGYTYSDVVGKAGLERSYEDKLNGNSGSMLVEVNVAGRRVRVLEESTVEPEQGNKVFLTIDLDLQKKCAEILEEYLKNTLKSKLTRSSTREDPITVKQVLASLVRSNNISAKKIFETTEEGEESASFLIKHYIMEQDPEANVSSLENIKSVNDIIAKGIEDNDIPQSRIILLMLEQGVITGDEEFQARVRAGSITPLTIILNKIDEGELTPQMINLDPSTGSIVVLSTSDNSVLAAVGYPSYDNNELTNNMNNEYYNKLNNDPSRPQINRPFSEPRAPGSTFKMITAAAGLEMGVISPTSTILDETVFMKAGLPYLRCHSASSHGRINVSKALEVSCNYFFSEVGYRLGNSKAGNTIEGIEILNEYMEAFGLGDRSGVEIGELRDSFDDEYTKVISSPEYKAVLSQYNQYIDKDWYDGDTVQTTIGQSMNNYTSSIMAKYISTLANQGKRYQVHLVDKVETQGGQLVEESLPNVETVVELQDSTWEAIYKGMLNVIEGPNGTGRNTFRGFPIRVAGKTGTAEENKLRSDHSSFGGFAPYEDPQIAIYVMVPYGDTTTMPALASQIARDVMAEYFGLNSEPEKPAANYTLVP